MAIVNQYLIFLYLKCKVGLLSSRFCLFTVISSLLLGRIVRVHELACGNA